MSSLTEALIGALPWLTASVLGGTVGAGELTSRYRDSPVGALRTKGALLYIIINISASAAAFALANTFGWNFGFAQSVDAARLTWIRVLVSGIGAMALFRTSLFIVRAGDRDIGVGPSSFLAIFLEAADREVDRRRAQTRASVVNEIMTGVDYAISSKALPPYCLGLMQNLPNNIQQDLGRALQLLDGAAIEPEVKVRLLGLELVNVVGVDVLRQAVKALGDEIKLPSAKEIPENY